MHENQTISLWDRIDPSLVEEPVVRQPPPQKPDEVDTTGARRVALLLLDVLGAAFWLYAILKLFVFNVDQAVFGGGADYRFFFFVAAAVWIAIVFRGNWLTIGVFAYILLFPIVVLGWKVPRLLYRTRSSVAVLATVNVLSSFFADVRHSVIVAGSAVFVGLTIAVSHSRLVLNLAAAGVVVLIAEAIYRTVKLSIGKARFVHLQQAAIRRVVRWQPFLSMISPDDDLLRADIVKFNRVQQLQLVQSLGMAVIAHRVLSYWAYQLEEYRKSPAPLFFNVLAYAWLVVRVVLGLAFLNLALYHADPAAFTFSEPPTFLVIVRYVLTGLYGGEISALHARSDLSNVIGIATICCGVLLIGSLAISSLLSYRSKRDESEIQDTISEIKAEGSALESRLRDEYEVSLPQAIARLEELKFGLIGLVTFLSTRIPSAEG